MRGPFRCHGWRHLTHCFGGYFGSPDLLLLTLVLPFTNRTYRAKRETCTRFHQYSSLPRRVYNDAWGGFLFILEMLHYDFLPSVDLRHAQSKCTAKA